MPSIDPPAPEEALTPNVSQCRREWGLIWHGQPKDVSVDAASWSYMLVLGCGDFLALCVSRNLEEESSWGQLERASGALRKDKGGDK